MSLTQGSSTMTSPVLSAVAGEGLTFTGTIPIVPEANVDDTSATNTIVSLAHITKKMSLEKLWGLLWCL